MEPTGTYAANTNLEEISDWLTKILVGAGLTQIAELPGQLQRLIEYAAANLGGDAARTYAAALLVFYFLGGFLTSYLWARLYLVAALQRATAVLARTRAKPRVSVRSSQPLS